MDAQAGELSRDLIIALWFHYEEIAMHFNELILQYRMTLIGGLGAVGAFSSYLIGSKLEQDSEHRNEMRFVRFLVSLLLLVMLIAAAALDLLYYNELLKISVDVILDFEKQHPWIIMSTMISHNFGENFSTWLVGTIYLIFILPLTGFTIWTFCAYKNPAKKTAA